jgi:hypothetical protein
MIRVVVISEDCALEEPFGGWIIDTSRGGVRLRVPREVFPVGTLLYIRAPLAPVRVPWTLLRVKHSQLTGDAGEMGCEFVESGSGDTARIAGPGRTRVG